MSQHRENYLSGTWPGWSTISAKNGYSFTIWLTGLAGTDKTTLATLLKKALVARGYKVEIIDTQALTRWLHQELQINEAISEDSSHTMGYDAFVTYLCTLLARNGIICITTSVSPFSEARKYAREQIPQFIEVYLHCSTEQRQKRLAQLEDIPDISSDLYQAPTMPELSIETSEDFPERDALRVISYLEQHSYLAPLWENVDTEDEEVASIKARLQAMGYLE
jgi:adenylylsulfate kinase-like enzyme